MSEEKIQPSRKERVGGAAIVLMAGNRTFEKKKIFARPALARAAAGWPQPIRAGGGRSLIRRRWRRRCGLRRVGPGVVAAILCLTLTETGVGAALLLPARCFSR